MDQKFLEKLSREYEQFLKIYSTSVNAWHATLKPYKDLNDASSEYKKDLLIQVRKQISDSKKETEKKTTENYMKRTGIINAVEARQSAEPDLDDKERIQRLQATIAEEKQREAERLRIFAIEQAKLEREKERKEKGDEQFNLPFGNLR